jgi:8-oxo-dGTP pyrophosphatase MutT (NUDIX family)
LTCRMVNEPASRGWSRLSSTVLFTSKWLQLRRDNTVRPDGSQGEYDHVVVPESVTVLAVEEDGRLAVTRQWIYVHQATQWRLPSGRIEEPDPDPEAAARRELREETGVSAERLVRIGTINCADSFTNHREHAFLATGLRHGGSRLEAGEADLEVHWLPFEQVLDLVTTGRLPHAGSSFAVLCAHTLGLVGERQK